MLRWKSAGAGHSRPPAGSSRQSGDAV